MRYSFRNTLCGLAVLAAAGLLADLANAQGTVSLLDDSGAKVDLSSNNDDLSLNVDVSLPSSGLISPSSPEKNATPSTPSDVIPMDVDNHDVNRVSMSFDDGDDNGDDIDMQIDADPRPVAQNAQVANDVRQPDTSIAAVLNKKEKIANEIAAVKAQRLKAQQEEEARKAEEERKRIEWENEQERLMVEEQRKLKEVEMALEKLRQEKIIKAYKETMLASTQKWIKKNAEIYAEIAKRDEQIKEMLKDYKEKFGIVAQKAEDVRGKAEVAKVNHDKKVANLENQISILKTRLEAEMEKARQAVISGKAKKNPFADGTSEAVAPEKVKLSREYAIMEILGSGDDLAARLINEDGDVFMVKVGTTLRNGYTVDEITKTFLSAVKENDKDYLYFAAGGILDREPVKPAVNIKEPTSSSSSAGADGADGDASATRRRFNVTKGIPSLGKGMIVK